ncbi:MAG: ROK family protein [Bacteroidales bacterium]|nr:ROK family protein [Bacteroides sp.]MCM1198930.1 ROK family protein [Clostridium sp.]MCM1501145.1 ROK family protein [Bacteroidales bacterium]
MKSNSSAAMRNSIMSCFLQNGTMMIPAISEMTGYSIPTVTKFVQESMKAGIVIATEKATATGVRGRKAILYSLNPGTAYFLGVDTRHHGLSLALMDITGKIAFHREYRDLRFMNTPQYMEKMCMRIKDFIAESGIPMKKISLACFNISGRVDTERGLSHSIFAFEDNDGSSLAEILEEKTGIRSVIENDTRAMLRGELSRGGVSRYRNCLYVNVSWGLGLGILMDGKIYCGANGFAGEFGHINAFNNEIICHCGKKGCLETEVSGLAAKRIFTEQIAAGKSSVLKLQTDDIRKIKPQDIIRAANNEDTLCQDIIETMGRKLGRQLANLINIFNPEAVIIGGSMSKDNDFFVESIKMGIKKYSLRLINRNLTVEKSSDPDHIGVIGACMVARERFVRDSLFNATV